MEPGWGEGCQRNSSGAGRGSGDGSSGAASSGAASSGGSGASAAYKVTEPDASGDAAVAHGETSDLALAADAAAADQAGASHHAPPHARDTMSQRPLKGGDDDGGGDDGSGVALVKLHASPPHTRDNMSQRPLKGGDSDTAGGGGGGSGGSPDRHAQMKRKQSVKALNDKEEMQSALDRHAKPAGIYDPFSADMQKWDKVMFACLTFTAFVTPFEVGFTETAYPLEGATLVAFLVNRVVDCFFIFDIYVNFCLAYFDADKEEWVYEPSRVRLHYMKGWFSIDVVSVLPFEWVGLEMEGSNIGQLKIFRIIRLLRLIKLLRILKSARILTRIQALLGWSYASFELLGYSIFTLTVIHWIACCWGLIGKPDYMECIKSQGTVCSGQLREAMTGQQKPTWLTELLWDDERGRYLLPPMPTADYEAITFFANATRDWDYNHKTGDGAFPTPYEIYLYCLEFALCILVISYAEIVPLDTFERSFALFFMLVGGTLYAYMIGAICGLVSMADPATQEFQNNSDLLNEYIRENSIRGEHKLRLREFFSHCKEGIRMRYYKDLLELLSPAMQKGLAMRVHSQRISSISVFNCSDRDERERFLAGLAISLDTAVFPPQEVIFACGDVAELIYFIHKGIVSAGSACNVYKSGDHIGLDALLPENRRETAARALTFVLSYSLSQVALYDVLDNGDFPKTASLLRRHRAKLALKQKLRQVVALAKATGLVCPDGTTFEEGKRIFKDAAEVDRFKGTLKPGPPKEEFEARQQEVLDQIARDRAEGEKMRNKRELEFLLGREVEVATEIDASSVYAQRAMEADFAQKDGDDDGVNPQVAAVVDRIDRLEGAVLAMSSRLDAILAPLDAAVATPLLPPVAP